MAESILSVKVVKWGKGAKAKVLRNVCGWQRQKGKAAAKDKGGVGQVQGSEGWCGERGMGMGMGSGRVGWALGVLAAVGVAALVVVALPLCLLWVAAAAAWRRWQRWRLRSGRGGSRGA